LPLVLVRLASSSCWSAMFVCILRDGLRQKVLRHYWKVGGWGLARRVSGSPFDFTAIVDRVGAIVSHFHHFPSDLCP
jgi:hypothetical protein